MINLAIYWQNFAQAEHQLKFALKQCRNSLLDNHRRQNFLEEGEGHTKICPNIFSLAQI